MLALDRIGKTYPNGVNALDRRGAVRQHLEIHARLVHVAINNSGEVTIELQHSGSSGRFSPLRRLPWTPSRRPKR